MCNLTASPRANRPSATSPARCATSRATCRCCPACSPTIPRRSFAPPGMACASSPWPAGACRRRRSPSQASTCPLSHRRGLERGVDLGSRLFRCCVSYMLARLRQRLAQPRDRSICRPQIVEVAIPHQFGLRPGCAHERVAAHSPSAAAIRRCAGSHRRAPRGTTVRSSSKPNPQAKRAFIPYAPRPIAAQPNYCRPACILRRPHAFKQVRQLNCRCSAVSNADNLIVTTWRGYG